MSTPFDADAHVALLMHDEKKRAEERASYLKEADIKIAFNATVRRAIQAMDDGNWEQVKKDVVEILKSVKERPSLRESEGLGDSLRRLRFRSIVDPLDLGIHPCLMPGYKK